MGGTVTDYAVIIIVRARASSLYYGCNADHIPQEKSQQSGYYSESCRAGMFLKPIMGKLVSQLVKK